MRLHRAENAGNVVGDFYIPHCSLWTKFLPSDLVPQTSVLHHCVTMSCLCLYTVTRFEPEGDNKNIPSISAVTVR